MATKLQMHTENIIIRQEPALAFTDVANYLSANNIAFDEMQDQKPWGGYFVISEVSLQTFITHFFPELNVEEIKGEGKISPKLLLVLPTKRLSWQYHHRRSELWKLVDGDAQIARSGTDEEQAATALVLNEIVELAAGERHRLVGGDKIGLVAEIWRHTKAGQPSDEDDIVRVQDDFGR